MIVMSYTLSSSSALAARDQKNRAGVRCHKMSHSQRRFSRKCCNALKSSAWVHGGSRDGEGKGTSNKSRRMLGMLEDLFIDTSAVTRNIDTIQSEPQKAQKPRKGSGLESLSLTRRLHPEVRHSADLHGSLRSGPRTSKRSRIKRANARPAQGA